MRWSTIVWEACRGAIIYGIILALGYPFAAIVCFFLIRVHGHLGLGPFVCEVLRALLVGVVVGAIIRGVPAFLAESRRGAFASHWLAKTIIIALVLFLGLVLVVYIITGLWQDPSGSMGSVVRNLFSPKRH